MSYIAELTIIILVVCMLIFGNWHESEKKGEDE